MAAARTSAVHWARGAVIALLAALAVLIHHETAAITATPMQHAAHSPYVGHAMPGMVPSSAAGPHGSAAHRTLDAPAPEHGLDGSTCAGPGMQHCATASVDTVKLAAPPQGHAKQAANPHQAKPGLVPAGTIGRAPPDLSVLSQLRI